MAKARHVVVTGGGRGVGAATARRFKELGYRVTVMARTRAEIEGLADEIGAYAVRIDVGDPASVEAAFMAAGPVDVLVNNAGMVRPSPVTKTDVRVWEEHLKVNLTGAFLCALKVLPGMISRQRGRIINVAGTTGLTGVPNLAALCASKHGLVGFTRALAVEVGHKGVTVNAICPGFVDTPSTRENLEVLAEKQGTELDALIESLKARNPQNRLFTPEEVAEAITWLASPGSQAINGAIITMDGGELAG
ncbi:MAG: SDR family oxidoreductase [Deltaproteobacteria bacterium]|nr:MAG: SDR family oxidoreductase [Deltaproteobacteria bacterium]